jgi:hypothetical protein
MAEDNNKKTSFKKFSDMDKSAKIKLQDVITDDEIFTIGDFDTKPNLPNKSKKVEKPTNTKSLKPKLEDEKDNKVTNEQKVEFYGKLAKLPKGTKASKGFNFLENVKIAKNSIWYIMVEKCENELQMVKYNYKKGVDLSKFIAELKGFYSKQYAKNPEVLKAINAIEIDGNDKYSWIKNIPLVEVNGKKMISKITEDLIKLLSK